MAAPKSFIVKESVSELKELEREVHPLIGKRIQALIVFKKNEQNGISKREVAQLIGVNHNSIQTWRTSYIKGGIELLMSHSKKSNAKSVFTEQQVGVLKAKLDDPKNGLVGFKELLNWFNENQNTSINYKTFHGFIVRKFNAKVKTARKSHVNKDQKAVDSFKKTSVNSVNKQ